MIKRLDVISRPHPALSRSLHEFALTLTVHCNLRCKMCSVWEVKKQGVPLELAKKLLAQARALGASKFTPCGAESFMRKDFLDVVEYAHALGYHTQDVVTNGTMISDAHLDRLERCPSVTLHISIDGPRDVHDELRGPGNYDKSVQCAQRCVARGIQVGLSGVLLRETLDTTFHLIDLARTLGISSVSFQPFQEEMSGPSKDIVRFSLRRTPKERIATQLNELSEYARAAGVTIFTESMFRAVPEYLSAGRRPIPPGGCYLPSKFLFVDHLGDVYPCFFMSTPPADCMGNVYNDELTDIWHSARHEEVQTLALTERCPGCLAACSDVESFAANTTEGINYAPAIGHWREAPAGGAQSSSE